MAKKYIVRLPDEERLLLLDLISAGKAAARAQTHARILLKADAGPDGPAWVDTAIAEALETSLRTVERVREAWVTEGLEAALYPQRAAVSRPRKLDGEQQAYLVALACSPPPVGRERWTLRLLADRLIELEVVDSIAPETVRLALKQTRLSRG
jgi:transposase